MNHHDHDPNNTNFDLSEKGVLRLNNERSRQAQDVFAAIESAMCLLKESDRGRQSLEVVQREIENLEAVAASNAEGVRYGELDSLISSILGQLRELHAKPVPIFSYAEINRKYQAPQA